MKDQVIESLKNYPIVSIIGARQVGKTTLAKMIGDEIPGQSLYLDLEMPSDRAKLDSAEIYLKNFRDRLVIIDEIQRKPDLFPLLRALADLYGRKGSFLILGSASPDLKRQASESLAGRIIYHELAPFICSEVDDTDILWLRGGYPLSYLARDDDLSLQWRQEFIGTYLERDLPQLGIRVPSVQIRRFWQMVAHYHGDLWNASKISSSLGVSAPTARYYLDILHDTFTVRQLLPYNANVKKRLVKSPKVYIRDSGLLHALLGIDTMEGLLGHPVCGASWEGFIVEQISGIAKRDHEFYFYRTSGGAEMDLVIVSGKRSPIAVEIKRTLSPTVSKGFRQAYNDMSSRKGYIIYPGEESFPLDRDIEALPASMIGNIFVT